MKKKIALITGASSGIGEALAFAIDRDPHIAVDEIWLVARRGDRLTEISKNLTRCQGVPVACDLTSRDARASLVSRIQEEEVEVNLLINNAGRGGFGSFINQEIQVVRDILALNIDALVELTHTLAPRMTRGSNIVQIASGLAYIPAPYAALYAATKSFVLHFSEALSVELKHRGIRVLTVCPGPVETEFYAAAKMPSMVLNGPFLAKSDRVAREILAELPKSTRVLVPVFLMRQAIRLARWLPRGALLTGTAQTLRNWGKSEKIR